MVINTNIQALISRDQIRLNAREMSVDLERLSTGARINHGADDPSGLGISMLMRARITGVQAAMENTEDALNMLRYADSILATFGDILQKMRDVCLRLANRATLNANPAANPFLPAQPSESRIMRDELSSLMEEMQRTSQAVAYNGKPNLLYGDYAAGLQDAQIGPDNSSENRLNIVLPDLNGLLNSLTAITNPFDPPTDAGDQEWHDFATAILDDIDEKNPLLPAAAQFGLPSIGAARGDIGIQMNRLSSNLDGLHEEYINLMSAKSRIMDADIAEQMTHYTKSRIMMQASIAVTAQANARAEKTLALILNSIG